MTDVILMGPFIGELGWEAMRFAPMLPYMKFKKYKGKDIKYIIYTRPDRFDLYGTFPDILVPLRIDGDGKKFLGNCYRLNNFPLDQYHRLASKFEKTYKKRFNVVKHIFPKIDGKKFSNKSQYSKSEMSFKYSPRKDNYQIVDKFVPKDKPLVVLAPRYRIGFQRNWKYWNEFYDMLSDHSLRSAFNFIICGKEGEYFPDKKDRFLDLTKIPLTENSSLVGILMVILERTFFTCGSQSAIPNMSLLYGVQVLSWGHQKRYHTVDYNIMHTPITFIEDMRYKLDPKVVLKTLNKILTKKLKGEGKHGKTK